MWQTSSAYFAIRCHAIKALVTWCVSLLQINRQWETTITYISNDRIRPFIRKKLYQFHYSRQWNNVKFTDKTIPRLAIKHARRPSDSPLFQTLMQFAFHIHDNKNVCDTMDPSNAPGHIIILFIKTSVWSGIRNWFDCTWFVERQTGKGKRDTWVLWCLFSVFSLIKYKLRIIGLDAFC